MPERRRGRAGRARPAAARSAPGLDAIVTNPEKVLWPDRGISKLDLIRYYRAVAPVLMPHLRDRPLVMKPYPAGITGRFFFRQTLPATAPAWMPRWEHAPREGAAVNRMPLAQDEAALTWLANQAAIEMHPWLSRIDAPDEPDYVAFDLDILDPDLFPLALEAALLVREAVGRRGLVPYAKTSGGDGVHLYIPIRRGPAYDRTRAWALALAESLRDAHPAIFSTESRIAGRERLVLIDYAQNAMGKTTVAAYSVRPKPGATVSTPLTWEEVEAGRLRPADLTIETVPARIAERGDLFAPVLAGTTELPESA